MCIWAADHQMVLPIKLLIENWIILGVSQRLLGSKNLCEGKNQNAQCRICAATVVL